MVRLTMVMRVDGVAKDLARPRHAAGPQHAAPPYGPAGSSLGWWRPTESSSSAAPPAYRRASLRRLRVADVADHSPER